MEPEIFICHFMMLLVHDSTSKGLLGGAHLQRNYIYNKHCQWCA